MRYFVLLLCLAISLLNVCLADIEPKNPPKFSDANMFLNYSKGTIYFPDFSIKEFGVDPDKNVVFKVPTSRLGKFGLKIGSVIQSVDASTGKKNPDFVLKDYVYGIWPPIGDENELSLKSLRVILSYDEKVIEEVKKISSFGTFSNGFAYIGLGRKLFEIKENLIPVKKIPKANFKLENWNLQRPKSEIFSAKLFENILYIYYESDDSGGGYDPILKTSTDYFRLPVNGSILTSDRKKLRISDWGKNEKLLILGERFSPGCSFLYFIKPNSISYVPLPCSSRDY